MTKAAKFNPKLFKELMPLLLEEIKKCEQMRGSGIDMKLRNLFEQLQHSLNKK